MAEHVAAGAGLRHRCRAWLGGGWFGRGRTRALATLGLLASLGVAGTSAYWTDTATVTGAAISTGRLDLTAGPSTGAESLAGTGPNSWTYAALALSDVVPDESVAAVFVVRNSGSTPLRFNATVRSTTNDLTSGTQGLLVQVHDLATAATNTGTQAGGNRSGACTGSLVFSGYVSTTSSVDVLPADISLAATGSTRSLCVRAWLDSAAPNALQSTTTTMRTTQVLIDLSAEQVVAP